MITHPVPNMSPAPAIRRLSAESLQDQAVRDKLSNLMIQLELRRRSSRNLGKR